MVRHLTVPDLGEAGVVGWGGGRVGELFDGLCGDGGDGGEEAVLAGGCEGFGE